MFYRGKAWHAQLDFYRTDKGVLSVANQIIRIQEILFFT